MKKPSDELIIKSFQDIGGQDNSYIENHSISDGELSEEDIKNSWGNYVKGEGWNTTKVWTGRAVREWILHQFKRLTPVTPDPNNSEEYSEVSNNERTIYIKNAFNEELFLIKVYQPNPPISLENNIWIIGSNDALFNLSSIDGDEGLKSLSSSGTTPYTFNNYNYYYIVSKRDSTDDNKYYSLSNAVTNNNENITSNFNKDTTTYSEYVITYIHFDVAPTNLGVTLTFKKQ